MRIEQKQPRVFYGWWVVGACFFISVYTAGVVFFGFTAVFEPIAKEFGWSYAQVSLAASLRGLETGLLAPLVGFLVDRWGPRKLIVGGAIVGSAGLMLLSQVNSLGAFYGAFILVALGLSTCSGAVFLTAVVYWFRKDLAIATGIVASGFALGGLLVPPVAALVDAIGWRGSMFALSLGMWGIVVPLAFLVRHKPEHFGWLPDGEVRSTVVADGVVPAVRAPEVDMRASQALRSSAFWHISLALICQALVINAVVVHVMPYLSSLGVARSASSLVASAVPVTSILGRLTFGWFGDRFDKRRVAATGFVMTGVGLLLFSYAATVGLWLLVPFVVLFAIGWGSTVTMRVALLREHFGRSSFGTIHGFALGVMMLGNITGPPVAGWVFDTWGSYQGVWLVFAGLALVSVVIVAATPLASSARRPAGAPTP